jgi:5'-nucleotidase (lipoprotein e(P4) family)
MKQSQTAPRVVTWSLVVGLVLCTVLSSGIKVGVAQTTSSAITQTSADSEYLTGTVLWTQSSAEYRALAYQTFTLARMRLDQDLLLYRAKRGVRRQPAVIVDVDETVLDNTRYEAELVLRGLSFDSVTWSAWCQRAEAGAVPGAVDFLKYAARRGVHVFYITNRRQAEKAGTITNLRKFGFPDASEDNVMVREEGATSSKESRRQKVASRFNVLLLVGDILSDFNDHFSGESTAERATQANRESAEFGTRFIVVPNPMYGDWENAIYENKSNPTANQKRAYRRSALKGETN